ncbi:MAG: hypothetical protein QOG04_1530 [Actinomycetota bacterium]|nr:hypothetical protein [Actinomycetota bacterium]
MAEELSGILLVVSDDPDVEQAVRFGLPNGVGVVSVNDSRAASKTLETLTPRAVIVDLQTGSAGGFGLTKDMSQIPRLASIPVIVLLERDQDRWLAKQSGATLTLKKPITGAEIVAAVSSVLAA